MENDLFLKINEVREKADIVDVISRYVNVVKKGKDYKAVCPFHDDTNPSLSITRDKQIFNCFVCHEKGNVFTFVQKFKKIPFMQAVKEVADIVGAEFVLKEKKTVIDANPKVQVLYDLLKDVALFYMNNLNANQNAIEYCKSRNISSNTLNEFKIGFSSSPDNVIRYLETKGYSKEDIYRSGIAYEENGNLKDRFNNRLIFPITDVSGHIVAFSGRIIEKIDAAKYANSPETEIFIKGNTMYHYASALDEIKRNKKIFICEGFMDCIALCNAGIKNSVALMGTAFTKEHLRILKFLGAKIVLCLDGDLPGNLNANKLSNELIKLNIDHEIVPHYEDVKDLDEFINKYGSKALIEHVTTKTMDNFDFNIYIAEKTSNLNNNEDKKKFLKDMANRIASMEDVDVDMYANKLHNSLGFSLSTIMNLVKESRKKKNETNSNDVIEKIREYKKLDKYVEMQLRVISSMLDSSEAIQKFIDSELFLSDATYRKLSIIICEYYQDNIKNFNTDYLVANLFSQVEAEYSEDKDLIEALSIVDEKKDTFPTYSKETFEDLIYNLQVVQPLEERLNKIKEDIKFVTSEEEKSNLLKEAIQVKSQLAKLKKRG